MKNYLQSISEPGLLNAIDKKYFCEKELSAEFVDNGFVLPVRARTDEGRSDALYGFGGVVDSRGNYVSCSAQTAINMKDRVSGGYSFPSNEVVHFHETVIYMNAFIHQWGHFLIDVISRLWYVVDNTDYRIVYTCRDGEEDVISGNYLELLKFLGISEDRLLLINRVSSFDMVIIPDASMIPGGYYTREYKLIFDIIVEKCEPFFGEGKKIYCSRALLNNTKDDGEDNVEKVFNDNGFDSVYFEKMSLKDQIICLNSADQIALINGSLAHNLLFLRRRVKVYIMNKTYRVNIHQTMINQISDVDCCYIDVFVAPEPVLYGYGPFLIRVTPEFEAFCKDNKIINDNNSCGWRLSLSERVSYELKWLFTYKRFLLLHKKICEGGYDLTRKSIKKHFRKMQKQK